MTKVTQTQRTEILFELTPEIIDLKLTRTENYMYRTEHDVNMFYLNHFFSRKAYWTKNQLTQNRLKLKSTRTETEPEPDHIDSKMTRSELEPNEPFARSSVEQVLC